MKGKETKLVKKCDRGKRFNRLFSRRKCPQFLESNDLEYE
jgi:hypothetical protein